MEDEKKISELDKKLLNTSMYDFILRGFMLTDPRTPLWKGSEGEVYSYDNFIIKSYVNAISDFNEDETLFRRYCEEMQKFKNMGVNLPTFYTWLVIKNNAYNGYPTVQKNKYLILEEKVQGTQISSGYLEENYSLFEDFCSEEEFKSVLNNPLGSLSLIREILKKYIGSIVEVNEMLESMPESAFEKLIVDTFNMFLIGKCSEPDLFGANVFISPDKKDLFVIDNRLLSRKCDNEEYLKRRALLEVFRMFETNDIPLETLNEFGLDTEAPEIYADIMKLISKNNSVCKSAILKLAGIMKKIESDPKIINAETFKTFGSRMREIFGEEYAKDITAETVKIFM